MDQDFSAPKKRVRKPSMKMVRMMAMGACMKVAHSPTALQKPSYVVKGRLGLLATASATGPFRKPKPTMTGVPTAPKVTGTLLKTRQITAAAMAGKPRASSRGAAGVPKPAAPSMNAPNMKPMMMAWRRRSRLTFCMPC